MASFAERRGFIESRTVIQRDSLDDETRLAFWNLLAVLPGLFERVRAQSTQWVTDSEDNTQFGLLDHLWTRAFKRARDERPNSAQMWQIIKSTILKDEWWVVLNTIEEIAGYLARNETQYTRGLAAELVAQFNESFERYLLGFRFIGREITPVDSNEEALAIVTALDDVSRFGGAKHHLTRAVDLLADRQTPDYPNSIKESISAVEAVVKLVTGEGTLGSGIKKLQAAGMTIHPALESGWSKLYGWTSDANGIRHAGIVPADADQALAKYMLVTCSAFVSYLIEAGRKAGLLT